MKKEVPVTVHRMDTDEVVEGKVLNIGAGGCLVEMGRPLHAESAVSVKVNLGDLGTFFAVGQVSRVQDAESYQYAIQFTMVEQEEKFKLLEALTCELLLDEKKDKIIPS